MARVIELTTPLEKDVLLFKRMHATEELGRLFQYDLTLLSLDPDVDLAAVLGNSITVTLELADGEVRHFNGICSRISAGGRAGRFHVYHATVRPWFWFLTRTTNCRIFQDKTVPDILKEIFAFHAIANFEDELTESYTPWSYCVQYQESDFAFVSRLMEQEGIYYYFRHSEGRHALVLSDSYAAHEPAYAEALPFIPPVEHVQPQKEHVSEWSHAYELVPGKYALRSYDFEKPSVDLQVRSTVKREHALSDYEVFEYGGDYVERSDGEMYARLRLEEAQAKHEQARGATNARALAPGYLFSLAQHPRADQNAEYLVVSAEYDLQSGEYEGRDAEAAEYSCRFTALASRYPYRSERLTPKPIVHGPQTAIVVGPAGEEIYKDDYGRVKVQFHWDRYGTLDENSSCWIRVSEAWAGKGWGSVSTPRIGHEVVVSFLDGDPDQPLITGSVYNAENMPPHGGVVSGMKSNTHKGSGSNEISIDDTAGSEKITIHGQYDMNTKVENNQTNVVGVDQTEEVGSNREVTIGANDKLSVGANRETSIGAKHTVTVGADESVSVGGSRTAAVAGKEDVSIGGKSTLQVGSMRTETIAGPHTIVNPRMTVTAASQMMLSAGSNFTASSSKINLLAGSKLIASSGGTLDVKAAGALTQQSGGAMNVKSGAGMNTQSSGAMNIKAGGAMNAQAGGAMNLKSGGALTGKGSVIKLNSPTKIKGTTLTVQ